MQLGMRIRFTCRRTLVFLVLVLAGSFAQSAKPQHARLSLISDHNAIVAGEPEWIGLRFDLDPGWHIYWTNPGDSGEPPRVTWELPAGLAASDLQFPAPQRISDHSLIDYGYQGSVVLLAKLTSAKAPIKQAEIGADVRYLVCREVCVPGKDHVSLTLPIAAGGNGGSDSAEIQAAKKHLPQPLPHGVQISGTSTNDGFSLRVTNKNPEFADVSDFIPADEQVIENAAKPVISFGKDVTVIKLKKSEQLDHSVAQLRGLLVTRDRAYNVLIPVSAANSSSQTHRTSKKS